VSDISISWLAVSRSAWRQRLRVAALALAVGVVAALILVLLLDSEPLALAGGGCALLAALSLRSRGVLAGHDWRISAFGRVLIRWNGAEPAVDATPTFISSFLIVLRQGRRTLEIWRDAAPPQAFRRLSVAVRWCAHNPGLAGRDQLNGPERT